MGGIEVGTCEICGIENVPLERTYFYYPIHCECCGCKDKDGQKLHFVEVSHCKDCTPEIPLVIHPLLKDMCDGENKASISNIMPCAITGRFIINRPIIKYPTNEDHISEMISNRVINDVSKFIKEEFNKQFHYNFNKERSIIWNEQYSPKAEVKIDEYDPNFITEQLKYGNRADVNCDEDDECESE